MRDKPPAQPPLPRDTGAPARVPGARRRATPADSARAESDAVETRSRFNRLAQALRNPASAVPEHPASPDAPENCPAKPGEHPAPGARRDTDGAAGPDPTGSDPTEREKCPAQRGSHPAPTGRGGAQSGSGPAQGGTSATPGGRSPAPDGRTPAEIGSHPAEGGTDAAESRTQRQSGRRIVTLCKKRSTQPGGMTDSRRKHVTAD